MGPKIYRRRLIPDECILLDKDRVLYRDDQVLITAWQSIHPRSDLAFGYSCYFLPRGFKVSRMYSPGGQFLHWYCDIIKTAYEKETDTYRFTDLLADVVIFPDGALRVLDLDELADALEQGLLAREDGIACLRQLDGLLRLIREEGLACACAQLLHLEEEDRSAQNARRRL